MTSRVLGELTLSFPGLQGATAFVPVSSAHPESFHLLYAGDTVIALSRDHRVVDVDFVSSNGAPALADCYQVNMLHAATDVSAEEHIVGNGRQLIPLAGAADLDPGTLLGTSSSPLLRLPLETVLSEAPAPSLRPHGSGFSVPGTVPSHSMGVDQPSQPPCLDPFVHHQRRDSPDSRRIRGLFDSACRPPPFTCAARTIEHRPTHELSTSMEPFAVAHARNRI